MSKKILIFIIVLLSSTFYKANAAKLACDTTHVSQIHFSAELLDELRDEADYFTPENPANSLFQRIMMWLSELLRLIFSDEGAIPYIRYMIFFGIIVFVLIKLFSVRIRGIFYNDGKNSVVDIETPEELEETDFDSKIELACKEGNYRLAVRYHYLRLLRQLYMQNLIGWKIDKTNRDYQEELQNHAISSSFGRLSSHYEFIWYGNFSVDESAFQKLDNEFQKAIYLINGKK